MIDPQAIFQQLEEVLLQGERPSEKLEAMRKDGTLHQVPALLTLPGVQQNPRWHPEGDVWIHTLMVVDEAVLQRTSDQELDRLLLWSALCHDLGKPLCTVFVDGRWKSPGHDLLGVKPTRDLLSSLGADAAFIEAVCKLVHDHLAPHFYAEERTSAAGIRRLLSRLGEVPLDLLVRLGRADSFGRTTQDARRREYPSGEWLLEQADKIPVNLPEPPPSVVMGRHLLAAGFSAGPQVGKLLRLLHQAQLANRFDDPEGGIKWLREQGITPDSF